MKRLLICLAVCLMVGCGESALDQCDREQAKFDRIKAEIVRYRNDTQKAVDEINAIASQLLAYQGNLQRDRAHGELSKVGNEQARDIIASFKSRLEAIEASADRDVAFVKTNLMPKLKQQAKKLKAARIAAGLE